METVHARKRYIFHALERVNRLRGSTLTLKSRKREFLGTEANCGYLGIQSTQCDLEWQAVNICVDILVCVSGKDSEMGG